MQDCSISSALHWRYCSFALSHWYVHCWYTGLMIVLCRFLELYAFCVCGQTRLKGCLPSFKAIRWPECGWLRCVCSGDWGWPLDGVYSIVVGLAAAGSMCYYYCDGSRALRRHLAWSPQGNSSRGEETWGDLLGGRREDGGVTGDHCLGNRCKIRGLV